jgi:hypothetical protein
MPRRMDNLSSREVCLLNLYEALVRGELVTGDRTYDEEQALAKKNPTPQSSATVATVSIAPGGVRR